MDEGGDQTQNYEQNYDEDEKNQEIVENVEISKLEEYREFFSMFDRDKNGLINLFECGNVIRSLNLDNLDEKDLEEAFNDIDQNHDKLINFDEFLTIINTKYRNDEAEEELIEALQYFDKNGGGSIPNRDFKHFMMTLGEKLSEEEADEMIRQADPDNTGNIDYKKFAKIILDN